MLSGCASMSCAGVGMNLYPTGFQDIGFNFEGLVILIVRFVIGEASRYFDCLTGVWRTSYPLPKGLNSLVIGIGSDSSVMIVFSFPSIAGSIRIQKRCC